MGKELINWENGRWIGQTLEVENGVCAVPNSPDGGLAYTDEVKAAVKQMQILLYKAASISWPKPLKFSALRNASLFRLCGRAVRSLPLLRAKI